MARSNDERSIVTWDTTGHDVRFAATTDPGTGAVLRLVVERLPRSAEWDWTVWQAHTTGMLTRTGFAPSARQAVAAAEAVARDWMAPWCDVWC